MPSGWPALAGFGRAAAGIVGAAVALVLTFDDGPDPVWTPRVLERLAEHGLPATFFVLGEQVRAQPTLLEEIAESGHAIELHGDRHLDHNKADPAAVQVDTEAALETLAVLGIEPTQWRLPWGRRGPRTDELAAAHGLAIVGWDYDTHDWRGDGWDDQPPEVTDGIADGGIVLLHDALGPGSTRTGCDNTLALIDALAVAGRAAGVGFAGLEAHVG